VGPDEEIVNVNEEMEIELSNKRTYKIVENGFVLKGYEHEIQN
jgi:hypothetical protein